MSTATSSMIYGIPFTYNDLVKFFKQFDPRKVTSTTDKKKIPGSKKTKKTTEMKGQGIKKPEGKRAKNNESKSGKSGSKKKQSSKSKEESEENEEQNKENEDTNIEGEEENEEDVKEEYSGKIFDYGDHPQFCRALEGEACEYFTDKFKVKFDYVSSCDDFPDADDEVEREEERWFIGHWLAEVSETTHIIPDKELMDIMDKYRPALFEISKEYGLKKPAMCMVWCDNMYE